MSRAMKVTQEILLVVAKPVSFVPAVSSTSAYLSKVRSGAVCRVLLYEE